ncbi:MAG TPA: SWIM zinc finger family protein [Anaerolineaceae bacterium]|nr:SWIM zinc finger family protein [Anaerolineaceae bacterium]
MTVEENSDRMFYQSRARRVRGGIKARSENGEFAKNWWARKWLLAMERLVPAARLQRGRHYARIGQVISMQETKDGISARVQGSRPLPYKVNISVSHLDEETWQKALDAMAGRAIFTAKLLAGEMPENIEEAFSIAGASLFPARHGDLQTKCSCPDWANPCKHIAATHYILGDRFDEDPFLLFRLRGRSQEEVLEGLRKRRSAAMVNIEPDGEKDATENSLSSSEPHDAPPENNEDNDRPPTRNARTFWGFAAPLDEFSVAIRPPAVDMPLLQRLGDPDLMGRLDVQSMFKEAYNMTGQFAQVIAFSSAAASMPEEKEEE